jgi:hypothetical protein
MERSFIETRNNQGAVYPYTLRLSRSSAFRAVPAVCVFYRDKVGALPELVIAIGARCPAISNSAIHRKMTGYGRNIDLRQKRLTPGGYVRRETGFDSEGGITTFSSQKGLI